MKNYERLTQDERNEIVAMINKEKSISEIARRLGRNNKAQKRHQEGHRKFTLKSYAFMIEAERLIKNHWSPELVAGRLR
ncbi:MAG: helix-turn-helix domain-containing protein [Endomicrobium sp.]|jgi:IS30 family transposase|nr:helix-turn-helix domain-containing protein [Endomicrobium sp.]